MLTAPVSVKVLRPGARIPTYGTPYAAGADLYALLEQPMVIESRQGVLVPTGFSLAIPEGYVGLVFARSGLATKQGLAPANKVGVIDSDYRGELFVSLFNHSDQTRIIESGDRVAQLVIVPYLSAQFTQAEELDDTSRGANGFGSTGMK